MGKLSKEITPFKTITVLNASTFLFSYFQYAGGFEPREAFDITADIPDGSYRDPMFIVTAVKK